MSPQPPAQRRPQVGPNLGLPQKPPSAPPMPMQAQPTGQPQMMQQTPPPPAPPMGGPPAGMPPRPMGNPNGMPAQSQGTPNLGAGNPMPPGPPPQMRQPPKPNPQSLMPPKGGPQGMNQGSFASGGVVDPAGQPSGWKRLWGSLMGKEQLTRAANPTPTPTSPPANQDTSIVRRAAEEAGRRNDEAKASRPPSTQSRYGDYGEK